ncbi:MAG: hypothetical protein QF535_05750 [Anaerolineales bacterium]|nr:hypothetical protein [Anaerolineales bacterium]
MAIVIASVLLFSGGAYFTGEAISWWRASQQSLYAQTPGADYTITSFFIDGTVGFPDDTYEPWYCPRTRLLTYHVDTTMNHYSGSGYCPASRNIHILERLTETGWCESGVVVSRTMALLPGYPIGGVCRYSGELIINDQTRTASQPIYYDVCKSVAGAYEKTSDIATYLYPIDPTFATCSKTNPNGASAGTYVPVRSVPTRTNPSAVRSWS